MSKPFRVRRVKLYYELYRCNSKTVGTLEPQVLGAVAVPSTMGTASVTHPRGQTTGRTTIPTSMLYRILISSVAASMGLLSSQCVFGIAESHGVVPKSAATVLRLTAGLVAFALTGLCTYCFHHITQDLDTVQT